jgi:hypothetical protein
VTKLSYHEVIAQVDESLENILEKEEEVEGVEVEGRENGILQAKLLSGGFVTLEDEVADPALLWHLNQWLKIAGGDIWNMFHRWREDEEKDLKIILRKFWISISNFFRKSRSRLVDLLCLGGDLSLRLQQRDGADQTKIR